MASIKKISGSVSPVTSSSILLAADEQHLFEAINWSTIVSSGADVVTWRLKDTSKRNVLKTIRENALKEESIGVTINKQYAGYTYYLEAELMSTGEKAGAYIYGFCDKIVNDSSWSKTKGGSSIKNDNESNPISFGDTVFLYLKTEGVNGSNLTVEIYNETLGSDNKIDSLTANVTNGEVNLRINNTYTWRGKIDWWVSDIEKFYIKVKDSNNNYILNNSGEDLLAKYLNIEDKIISENAEAPENLTPTKIGEAEVNILPAGILSLEKISISTTYDVCNDEVNNFNDYENFWILENSGKYYHWLKTRTNTEDFAKPTNLPFTISSTDKLKFTTTFKTLVSLTDDIQIRVKDSTDKYTFSTKTHPSKNKDEEHELEFESTNTPYQDTVQYFPNFELIFEYSFDGNIWITLGRAQFCFYLTWKVPLYSQFEMSSPINQNNDMKILCIESGKPNILETLLWLGCKKAHGKGNISMVDEENEEQILDSVFGQFGTKNVIRRREGEKDSSGNYYLLKDFSTIGMGYWRGISAVDAQSSLPPSSIQPRKFYDVTTGTHIERSSRVILKYGEFRCGEWSDFLSYCLICQGIETKQFAIFSGRGYNQDYYYLLNSSGRRLIYKNPDLEKVSSSGVFIENNYANWEFYVKGGWTFNDPLKPVLSPSTSYRAQGNNNPLHVFSDHVFLLFERSSKKWFDPSYGLKSLTNHSTDIDLLKEYASTALDRVAYLDILSAAAQYKTVGTNLENHLIKAIISNLFIKPPTVAPSSTGVISIIDSRGRTISTF